MLSVSGKSNLLHSSTAKRFLAIEKQCFACLLVRTKCVLSYKRRAVNSKIFCAQTSF